MERILRERDRLLGRASRLIGLVATLIALACLSVPGAIAPGSYLWCIPALGAVALTQWWAGSRNNNLTWIVVMILTGFTTVLALTYVDPEPINVASGNAIAVLMGAGTGSVAIQLTHSRLRILVGALGFAAAVGLSIVVGLSSGREVTLTMVTVTGWVAAGIVGGWLSSSVPRVMKRIANIGRAHRAERDASEMEAQRRQDARLLHDTVLATLTMLAHSGVGVSESALRYQAANDAQLLRQLRLGGSPTPRSSGVYNLEPATESTLGNTLESVKHRFMRMGLAVSWHGTGQVLLSSEVLDAFVLALGECLENVRRHSGVTEADVTITDDETTVRAMVTDAGVGFDLAAVDPARLGFAESVVARLRDVGGNARLFSSPGSGTTVVLEVPK
ncbi:sensor histidine kinase [Compostimonas suwonensis]|uniref:Signal transduction histidine kinase n=1 Tax=Compostimonas suwonensis TaxID=1048394 RepID=A0A2M9BUL6_9MICO|nr:ATP-binding protein [Compostimonas suwonensis]PJJ61645.1 signal transduction histidine kinase [Compostimonas suwonensis]